MVWMHQGCRRFTGRVAPALVTVALGLACASATPPDPTLEDRIADQSPRFEAPPVQQASDLWPPRWRAGDGWEIDEEVRTDGFRRIYRIRSDWGDFEVRGDEMLETRLHEFQAIAALEETSRTEEFAKAVARALGTPFVAAWNLITRPVDTVVGVPVGVLRFLARPIDAARGRRGELEPSAAEDLVGFGATKRELAYWLRVDPYSSNKALQRELNRVAWTIYAGELPFHLVPFARLERVSKQIEEIDRPYTDPVLRERVRLDTPEVLRDVNRFRLERMGVPEALREEFLKHPWYAPSHQTAIIDSLEAMELTESREAFIEVAVGAQSEEDAWFSTRTAELLRIVHQRRIPLTHLVAVDTLVGGVSADRELVVPLPVDLVSWTQPAEVIAEAVNRRVPGAASTRLMLTGELTERARDEFASRGIAIEERVFEDLEDRPAS